MLGEGVTAAAHLRTELVPAEVLRTVLQSVERCGHEAAPLLDRLAIEPRSLVSLSAFVPWSELVELVDAFVLERGQAELDRVARDVATTLPSLRALGGLLLPPRSFYRALCEIAAHARWWSCRSEETASTFTLSLEVRRALPSSPALFLALTEFLAATPRLLNLPDATVEVRAAHSHGARYVLGLPRGKTLQVRVPETQLAQVVAELLAEAPRRSGVPSVAHLEERFRLTRAEGRVVRRLVSGRSLHEIAKELGVGAETVRTHTKRAMAKTETHRQAELVALVLRLGGARAAGAD
jgi:DNA-binding CsgD family transcriptional regulator